MKKRKKPNLYLMILVQKMIEKDKIESKMVDIIYSTNNMDLTQSKLTRVEWDSIETPISEDEKAILQMIQEGFSNIQITKNKTQSLFTFLKVEQNAENEQFLYDKYFHPLIERIVRKYNIGFSQNNSKEAKGGGPIKKIKSIDALRIQNLEANLDANKKTIFEFIFLEFCQELCRLFSKGDTKYAYFLYTLIQFRKASISAINVHVLQFVNSAIELVKAKTDLSEIIERAYVFIEKNPYLMEYEDKVLFSHQKELFQIFNRPTTIEQTPKLVLYIAPTGTGKTLSPLGLSQRYRIIFVCVARHIGLALAKSAISMEKKIAFAFGTQTADDIRLHYYAAVDFTKDWRSGGIRKVDNSNGTKVEIMICDVKSYLTAMHYMLAFNSKEEIITYWDEPTITMDYETHDLHETIHRNWVENKIPNIVLSCATLPQEEEILDTISDFRERFTGDFANVDIHTIHSYDCRKSIPILTKDGFCALPHMMYSNHSDLLECIAHCEQNKTLLRYFDLQEIVAFAFYINKNRLAPEEILVTNYFTSIEDITMNSLKLYYLKLLRYIPAESWPTIYQNMILLRKPKYIATANSSANLKKSVSLDVSNSQSVISKPLMRTNSISSMTTPTSAGVLITTEDAWTLTDGPTIFLTEDATKIGQFYIQQSNIPSVIFQTLLNKILNNQDLAEKIDRLEKELEDSDVKESTEKKTKAKEKDDDNKSAEIKKLYKDLEALRKQVRTVVLDPEYIPNTKPHQTKWKGSIDPLAFCPNIDEFTVKEIMSLAVDNTLKVLLLLGIGLFVEGLNARYLEVMKGLAQNQDLFIIIASSDFIFGTNYNFCHGFIGKDMSKMTQAKTIQCLGRIGRSAIQSTYTVRFRDDDFIYNLFRTEPVKIEAINMSKLFCS
jgi:hypothetical protein